MATAEEQVSRVFTPRVIAALERLRLRARSLASACYQGSRRTRQRGRSMDFTDYRQYVPGDDPRDLDWNAFARFDSLLIRLFSAEVALPVVLLVDASPSMLWPQSGDANKFVIALRAAAALAFVAARSESPVSLLYGSTGGSIRLLRPSGFSEFLARLDALQPESFGDISAEIRTLAGKGSGHTVAAFTDGYDTDTVLPALGHLRASGNEVSVLHTLHRTELSPRVNEDVTLVDSESGEEVRIATGSDALKRYQARLRTFLAGWKRECRRIGAGYALLSDTHSMEEVAGGLLFDSGLAYRR